VANRGRNELEGEGWLAVIGRSLAYLCLHTADMADEDLATKSSFLISVGLPPRDAAVMLNSSEKSLGELRRRAKKKKGGGRAKKAKPRGK
jgi:hypothetical protein